VKTDRRDALDQELERLVAAHEVARPLTTMPGVGPVPAAAFVATVDAGTRFRDAPHAEAYLGLIPYAWSSSETQRRGHITKAGNGRLRGLWVQAAWGPSASAPETRDGRAARLGGADCRPARPGPRRGGPGAAPGGGPVGALAGWDRLRRDHRAGTAVGPTGQLAGPRGQTDSGAPLGDEMNGR